jgi:DNA helicase-2/ATP-dependent DNA helicase PcrA
MTQSFEEAYKKLNKSQKEAVEMIDGPVMVVAGPGTGKTQVLALRIAHILKKTDIGASGILCLTFTNSGVSAMRDRLSRYIGQTAHDVKVYTFHSFAQKIVEKHFELIDLKDMPVILDEQSQVLLYDELLYSNDWEYIRPRGNPNQYFNDLKSLISLLKREHVSSSDFGVMIDNQIESIENDESNISSRGDTKGNLKKDAQAKIESLKKSKEAVKFFSLYEEKKKDFGYMDYDDVLSYALDIVKASDDVKASLQEENQYILVDEHQDSSGIQNEFLRAVWGEVERPNLFVVGDDRQLIYGFGGADISYFEDFKHTYGKAHKITLIDNYRSTQTILDVADSLLKSNLAEGYLASNLKEKHNIGIYPCQYERDEILLAGKLFKEKIDKGLDPNSCALLVPKNKHVRSAVRILRDMGLPVSSSFGLSFFDTPETHTLRKLLKVIDNPYDNVSIGDLLLTSTSNINPLEAHAFIKSINVYNLSVSDLISYKNNDKGDLFSDVNPIRVFGKKFESWINEATSKDIYTLIQIVGEDYFTSCAKDHKALVVGVEVIRTYLHLAISYIEKYPNGKLKDFLEYIDRLESYHHYIPIAVVAGDEGINVMTLHGSKGLEFEFVHIAHMNESTLMNGKRRGFVVPEKIESLIELKDELTAKREVYVALTRAKLFCNISYSLESLSGASLEAARILSVFPDTHVAQHDLDSSIRLIAGDDPRAYVESKAFDTNVDIKELAKIISREYVNKNVSVTLLNNFFECPWKWYFNSFLNLPTPKTESLLLGSVVHTSIEFILKNKVNLDAKILVNIINESIKKELVQDKLLSERLLKNGKSILTNWMKNYYPHIEKSYMTERSVSYNDKSLPHLRMYGKIDLTETVGDGVIVTDFKTGSSKTKGVIEKRDEQGRLSSLLRQLAMYSYLLSGTNVLHSRLLFLEEDAKEKNAVYTTHIGQEEIDLLVRDIKEYDEALKTGSWVSRECHFKPYGSEASECEYCKKASIYLK